MPHKHLDYGQAEVYVDKSGENVFWDGWTIVMFKPNRMAYKRSNGMLRNGVWGEARRITVSDRGTWRVPVKS